MARHAVVPVQTLTDTGVDGKAATVMYAIVQADGHYIDVNDINTDNMIIHFKNTEGSSNDIIISAGVYSRSSLGSLTVSCAATSGEQLIRIESARFKDADGYILIDFSAATTGLIGAYLV